MAQSESYVDTIYRAIDAGIVEDDYQGSENLTPQWDNDSLVISDDASATVEIASATPEVERMNNIINDLTRIIIGKMGGIVPGFKILDCVVTPPPTETDTGTSTETSSDTDTNTETGTDTGTGSDTDTNTETGTDTGTGSDTDTNTETGTDTGTGSDTDTNTETDTDTSTGSDTDTNTETGTDTSTGSDTDTNTETGTDTSTGSDTDTNTETGTDTGTGSDTGTGTDVGDDDPIDTQKAYMNSYYGIEGKDGTSSWSETQLVLANELLETLPKDFRDCTDEIIRDGPPPEGAPNGASGYVKFFERKIHLLDSSTKISQSVLDQMTEKLGRPPTTEEQLVQIKFQFKKTIAHEMTHCFQNTHPDIYREWQTKFWPNDTITGSCPSNYGKQPYEDMAESVALYIMGGRIENGFFITAYGTQMDMERYNFVKTYILSGKEYLKQAEPTEDASI